MSNGQHIRAVGQNEASSTNSEAEPQEAPIAPDEPVEFEESWVSEDELELTNEEFAAEEPRFSWVAPALAIALIVGWTGLYGWAMQDQLLAAASAQPAEWVRWIIDWSIPVLLVCVGWLLTMRHSRAEAKRFTQTAALLSQESSELESRLTVVNRELSLAREFLGAQSRELETLGRMASERISTHAEELQQLIKQNGTQVDAIGSASETALSNMTRLRDDLPVVANSARDVSNQVGNAGRIAHEQLEKLVKGFERLNDFGKASETQVGALETRVGNVLEGFEGHLGQIEEIISARLEAVQTQTGSYREEIDAAEASALDALKERMTLLQAETKAVGARLREEEAGAMAKLKETRDQFEADIIELIASLDKRDSQARGVMLQRVKELNEENNRFNDSLAARDRRFVEEMGRRQEEFDTREAQASEVLAQRLADLDDALAERREAQAKETERLVAQSTAMSGELEKLTALISEVSETGSQTKQGLTEGLEELSGQLEIKRAELADTEKQLTDLTEAGIRLLEIIQSGARHSREDLPAAIETASGTLTSIEERAQALSGLMLTTNEKAEGLSEYLVDTQAKIEAADTSIQSLHSRLGEQAEDALSKLQGLRGGFTRLTKDSETFSTETQNALREGLAELEVATQAAFSALEEGSRERVKSLAGDISKDAVAELENALQSQTADTIGQLELATQKASDKGREVTIQLRDQLAKVNELTNNLEQRATRAREVAEEQVNNDFARRMALITDSLNSNAIDIASALSTEVTDTSWDAYLKGDRGIFTRRAVRLIDSSEAREISDLYQRDDAFKANVSRYIHDFEAMLRSMLSTRDGNALSVTLLGSDMGKLYVVLAQAIERLRQ